MHIEHVALWTLQLEALTAFYVASLGGEAGGKYRNPHTGFESIFVRFDGGARLEIMTMPSIEVSSRSAATAVGLAHVAFSVGSREAVDALTERLRAAGVPVFGEPRQTGDGYYESVVLDPDGNRIEITAS